MAVIAPQFSEKSKNHVPLPWESEILARLEEAKSEAIPTREYLLLKQRQSKFYKLIRNTACPAYMNQFLEIEDELEKSRLHFYTLSELRFALVQLENEASGNEKALPQLNAFTNMAEQLLESKIFYLLELSKQPQGAALPYAAHPSVRIFHPEDWTGDEILDAEKRIRLAPNAYDFGLDYRKLKPTGIRHPLSFSF